MKKLLNLFIFFICCSVYSQGVKFDAEVYKSVKDFEFDVLGFIDLPKSYSLRKYAPMAQEQKKSTCVGFSVGYSAMSIQYNREVGITSYLNKKHFGFDPYFLYAMISPLYNSDCEKGTLIKDALETLKKNGCKRIWMEPFLNCKSKVSPDIYKFSNPFKVKEYYKIPSETILDKVQCIQAIKKAVYYGFVPVGGISVFASMDSHKKNGRVRNNGKWKLKDNEFYAGKHSISIVGYNDRKLGGAFEIMNSWGDSYGDNGFMWVEYSTLVSILEECYLIETYGFSDKNCIVGNCENGYGVKKSNDYIEEGMFISGKLYGWGFKARRNGTGIYIGNFLNGKTDGNGFYAKSDSIYVLKSKSGKIIKRESLPIGFATKSSDQDKVFSQFYERLKNLNYYNFSNKELPENKLELFSE